MRLLRLARFATVLALAATLGCAAGGLTPIGSNQPVARQSLTPEFRVFYDALSDYGDWILIEPHGFVFRPRVAWNQWQPFEDGFWAPTDTWGWVWISAEPFGWATYHYGQWFFDRFQGWVWTPGVEWMPGSVAWTIAGDYVGWGPLQGRAGQRDEESLRAASSAMRYAPLAHLGSTDLRTRLVTPAQVGAALAEARPVRNYARVDGVSFNRGPALELVEERAGPLVRARIEDLVPGDLGQRVAGPPSRDPSGPRRARSGDESEAAADLEAIELTRRAARQAADEARRLGTLPGASPGSLPMVRPLFGPRGEAAPARPPRRDAKPGPGAAADTTR
jgi:hypothetical protein